jgi:hypothetical protein
MRWFAILVFTALLVFGVIRFAVPSESSVSEASAQVRTLDKLQKHASRVGVKPSPEVNEILRQEQAEAEQSKQRAQQSADSLRAVQIALTIAVGLLVVIVVTMLLLGKVVDTATKTFSFGSMTTIITFWFYVPKK